MGMYSKKTWGGTEDPTIEVSFKKSEKKEILSFVIYEYEDSDDVGRFTEGNDVSFAPSPPQISQN
jgi:hypothetical protein